MAFETKKETCTIKSIDSKIGGPWTNKKGVPQNFITGLLADGRAFSAMVPVADVNAAKSTFDRLIGKPGEFETSSRKDNQGNDVTSLWSWPGAPERKFGGGGGGKTYTVAFANTREGMIFTNESIRTQVALKAAVEMAAGVGTGDIDTVLANAAKMLDFLTKHTPAPQEAPKPAETMPAALQESPEEKAKPIVKAKVEAFEACRTIQGYEILAENVRPIRERLKAIGSTTLLADLDAAANRCESRFQSHEDIPF